MLQFHSYYPVAMYGTMSVNMHSVLQLKLLCAAQHFSHMYALSIASSTIRM